jgi:hypothetical protein
VLVPGCFRGRVSIRNSRSGRQPIRRECLFLRSEPTASGGTNREKAGPGYFIYMLSLQVAGRERLSPVLVAKVAK